MKIIPLTRGLSALVDDEDFQELSKHKWYAKSMRTGKFYACRDAWPNGKRVHIQMHREILGLGKGEQADHRNGNGLDNQRRNIRKCIASQNYANRDRKQNTTSRFRGVSWFKRDSRWVTHISKFHKTYNLGYYDSEIDAAIAYNRKAEEFFGEFARLNEITEVEQCR